LESLRRSSSSSSRVAGSGSRFIHCAIVLSMGRFYLRWVSSTTITDGILPAPGGVLGLAVLVGGALNVSAVDVVGGVIVDECNLVI